MMGKVLLFIYNDMADFEFSYATHLLGHELGKQVVVAAYDKSPVVSKGGITYLPHTTIAEVDANEFEGFIIPGGWNPVVKQEILDLINQFYQQDKLLAAICAGPRYFAKAGILDKVKYTTSIVEWNEMRCEAFKEEDPFPRQNFVNERVVRDKNVITSKGISFVDFGIEVANYFGMFKTEDEKLELYKTILDK